MTTLPIHSNHQPVLPEEITQLCQSKNLTGALYIFEKKWDATSLDSSQKVLSLEILLQACGVQKNYEIGTKVHELISASTHLKSNRVLNTRIITMYSLFGDLAKCRDAFDQIKWKNLHQWNAILSAYTRNACYHDALYVFFELITLTEYNPDSFTFPCVFKSCGGSWDVGLGMSVHGMVVKMGFIVDVFVANALVVMYGKFGMVEELKKVFLFMPERNLVSWNTMISVFVDIGDSQESFRLFTQLLDSGEDFIPDSATFVTALPLCAREGYATLGRTIHGLAMKLGLSEELKVKNSLIDMYSKCTLLAEAHNLFCTNQNRNLVTWNSIIGGYARNGKFNETCDLLRKMQMEGNSLLADEVTVLNALPVFSDASELLCLKELHGYSLRRRFEKDGLLLNAFISAYARCGSLNSAECVFIELENKTISSWNALIRGYVDNGESHKAFQIYNKMIISGIDPDSVSIMVLLMACVRLKLLNFGKQIHGFIVRKGLESDLYITASLLSFYFSCGFPLFAQLVFDKLTTRSLVIWNTMIAGYSQSRLPVTALDFFRQLISNGIQPDEIALVSLFGACSQLSALKA